VANDSLYSDKRLQHLQATIVMSDFDNAIFTVTLVTCISPFEVSPEQYQGNLTAK
jgi:hypothetical protein